ncbi:MAG: SPOR domain-containing protein [Crocinitomicaceae bacterium]|nr:SPOR domain-containing protein [Crocinitomicaceae bacterium]
MMKVEEIIGDLLIRHNCVIIPTFGGFVTQRTSAKIDYKTGVMSPPSKSLLFNRQLINNDGLLIAELAQRNEVSYEVAHNEISQIIQQWNATLSAGQRISIDKVGILFYDSERNICFEQDRYFNLLLSSYGLGNVHFLTETDVAIAQRKAEILEKVEATTQPLEPVFTIENKEEIKSEPIPQVETTTQADALVIGTNASKKVAVWKYVAAACLIPVLFYSFWIPMKTNVLESKLISFQDFNPFHKQDKSSYEMKPLNKALHVNSSDEPTLEEQLKSVESSEQTFSLKLTDDTYILVNTQSKQDVETTNGTAVVIESNQLAMASNSLNYIVGCFADAVNAENLVKELQSKGFNAFVKDVSKGLSRVSIGAVNTQDDLNQLISKATANGYSGWVLK